MTNFKRELKVTVIRSFLRPEASSGLLEEQRLLCTKCSDLVE